MKIELIQTDTITPGQERAINAVAASGFEQDEMSMLKDTIDHIHASRLIHIVYSSHGLAGFAMYRSCLWR
jgi:hypothetical protein